MTAQTKAVIKSYFNVDDTPDESQFADLVDSYQDVITFGNAVLIGGAVIVTASSLTSLDRIFLTRSTTGGTPGHLSYVLTSGNNVTINSSSGTDTSTINYLVMKG